LFQASSDQPGGRLDVHGGVLVAGGHLDVHGDVLVAGVSLLNRFGRNYRQNLIWSYLSL
jgi:hypothetical protein